MLRYSTFAIVLGLAFLFLCIGVLVSSVWLIPLVALIPLLLLGCWDITQSRHSLLRNYPILAHFRWLAEGIRPELHQLPNCTNTLNPACC
ncbi:hypothetical protein TBK1r_48100 [Stieleria magnilauensis]|uniref:Transmembrane protein (PGPGW) n=1 Tax=Stieleria magnilauensis TaxID=2527963 RepID=A0ABX5Y140_9BACT|nr:hypothetical protein TBK1r_48100 [Planctomycetes bacterium TBK1r]